MRASTVLIAICAGLCGCDSALDKFASQILGDRVVVVAPAPMTLTAMPMELTPAAPLEVLGLLGAEGGDSAHGFPHDGLKVCRGHAQFKGRSGSRPERRVANAAKRAYAWLAEDWRRSS